MRIPLIVPFAIFQIGTHLFTFLGASLATLCVKCGSMGKYLVYVCIPSQQVNQVLLSAECGMPNNSWNNVTLCCCFTYLWEQKPSFNVAWDRLQLWCECRSLRAGWGLWMRSVQLGRLNLEKVAFSFLPKNWGSLFSSRTEGHFFLYWACPFAHVSAGNSLTLPRKLWLGSIVSCDKCDVW